MNKHKKILIACTIFITLCLIGTLIYSAANKSAFLYCSPDEPRGGNNEIWQLTISSEKTSKPLDVNFLDHFMVNSEPEYFTITHPSWESSFNPFPVEVIEVTPGTSIELENSTLKFAGIGVAYYKADQSIDTNAAYQFYDEKFQAMNDEQLNNFSIFNTFESKDLFSMYLCPAVKFIFEQENVKDLMFQNIQIYDSRTHTPIGWDTGIDKEVNYLKFNSHIPLWHKTPVDVVFDVLYDNVTHEFAPKAGEGFHIDNIECRLLQIFEGVGFRSNYETNDSNIVNKIYKDTEGNPLTCFFFVCQPEAHNMPVTFEFLDKDGNKLALRSFFSTLFTTSVSIKEPIEKVALIKAHYKTKRKRIILHLPYIPGLPEQNNNISDLYDVYIPYIYVKDNDRFNMFMRASLQLNSSGIGNHTLNWETNRIKYPIEFKNVKVGDIAKVYSKGGTLSINFKDNELILQESEPLTIKLRKLFNKIFP